MNLKLLSALILVGVGATWNAAAVDVFTIEQSDYQFVNMAGQREHVLLGEWAKHLIGNQCDTVTWDHLNSDKGPVYLECETKKPSTLKYVHDDLVQKNQARINNEVANMESDNKQLAKLQEKLELAKTVNEKHKLQQDIKRVYLMIDDEKQTIQGFKQLEGYMMPAALEVRFLFDTNLAGHYEPRDAGLTFVPDKNTPKSVKRKNTVLLEDAADMLMQGYTMEDVMKENRRNMNELYDHLF